MECEVAARSLLFCKEGSWAAISETFMHQSGLEEKGWELVSLAMSWRDLKSRRRITSWMESKMAHYSVM